MDIDRVSIAPIKHQGAKPDCRLAARDPGLNELLANHIGRLQERAKSPGSLPCHFKDPSGEHQRRFELLRADTDIDFLQTAATLALNIQNEMKGNAKEGLFVAVNGAFAGVPGSSKNRFSAVLKLEVVDPVAGYLLEIGDEVLLATVKQLLIRPKELQKGALYPDPRPESDVVVGDTMDAAALYFLRGLGLTQDMAPREATAFLAKKVAYHFPLIEQDDIIRRIESTGVATAEEFVARNEDLLDDPGARLALLADLAAQARPVRTIDIAGPAVTQRLVAGPFKLSFPPSARAQLDYHQRPEDGRWEITIVTVDRPVFQ